VPLTHVSGSKYKAKCAAKALPAGVGTITAVYPGDASYAASVGTLTQTVNRAVTALTARIRVSPHDIFTLTAKLTASGHRVSGQPVSFSTGPTQLCAPDTSTRGVATCVLTAAQTLLVEENNNTIGASYPGNTSYQPSSVTATVS
jgi:hypothetical protein